MKYYWFMLVVNVFSLILNVVAFVLGGSPWSMLGMCMAVFSGTIFTGLIYQEREVTRALK